MTQRIQAPDGTFVDFPDGTDDATISKAMTSAYPKTQAAPVAPAATPDKGTWAQDEGEGFRQGAVTPIANLSSVVESGLKKLGVPVEAIDHAVSWGSTGEEMKAEEKAKEVAADKKGIKPGTLGRIAGGMAVTAPAIVGAGMLTANPFLAAAVGGAASGALESNAKTPGGVVTDAALGGATGGLTDIGGRATAAAIYPHIRPMVNALLKRGVSLTPGQITGGVLHRLEDAATSFPVIGDLLKNATKRGDDSYNIAAVNEALGHINDAVPKSMAAGHDAIQYAQDAFQKEYATTLSQMPLKADRQFATDVHGLGTLARNLPPDHRSTFAALIKNEVIDKFGQSGAISGSTFKDIDQVLGKEARDFSSAPNPYDRKYGSAVRELQANLRDLAARNHPDQAAHLSQVDAGYANLMRVETAAKGTTLGVFKPNTLKAATVQMDSSARKRASAAGNAKMQDLATAGADVMNRTVPDSGTGMRGMVGAGLALGLTGTMPHVVLNPLSMGITAAALAPYTKAGGKVATKILTKRFPWMQGARQAVDTATPVAAQAAAQAMAAKRAKMRGSETQ